MHFHEAFDIDQRDDDALCAQLQFGKDGSDEAVDLFHGGNGTLFSVLLLHEHGGGIYAGERQTHDRVALCQKAIDVKLRRHVRAALSDVTVQDLADMPHVIVATWNVDTAIHRTNVCQREV